MASRGWQDAFRNWGQGVLVKEEVPGLAVAAAEGGRPTFFHGFGQRDRERGLALTPDTVFGIGSITKSFTAIAILQLQEAGRLDVDDRVASHIPELRVPHAGGPTPMRIRHLLTHTAGLPPLLTLMPAMLRSLRQDAGVARDMGLPEDRLGDAEAIDTPDQMVALLNRTEIRPLGTPGEIFSYSNDSYGLLGLIVERQSGEHYEDYVRRHILEPAGMTRSTIDLARLGANDNVTMLYAKRKRTAGDGHDVVAAPLWWESPAMAPAGFLRSTPNDLLRYLEIFRTGGLVGERRILQAQSVAAMTARQVACAVGVYYGFGILVTPDHEGLTLVGHGGGIKGVAADITLVPECDLTVVALANLAGSLSGHLAVGLLNAYAGLDLDTPQVRMPDYQGPAGGFHDLAGHYASEEGAKVAVRVEGDRLVVVSAGDGKKSEARRVGARTFALPVGGEEMGLEFRVLDGETCVSFGLRVLRRVKAPGEDGLST